MFLKPFYKILGIFKKSLHMDEELIGLLSTVVIVRGFAWEMHQVLKLAIHLGKLSGISSFM